MRRIAVIGAGLSGLATARAVRRAVLPLTTVEVFESGANEVDTSQRLLRRHGARILLSPGLKDTLDNLDVDVNQVDIRPLVYYDHAGSRILYSVSAPTIDAAELRHALLLDCDVRYQTKINDYQALIDRFDLVIGCDGRRSAVRPAADRIIDQSECDHGLFRIIIDVPLHAFSAAEHHDLAFVGQRSMISVARYGDRLRVSLVSPLLTDADADDVARAYHRITGDWLHPVRDLIDNLDDKSTVSFEAIRDRDPPRLRSSEMSETRFALAGDGLWSFLPYTGHAVKFALDDAVSIARSLTNEDHKDLQSYWRRVGNAAVPFIDESRGMLSFMHHYDASARLAELQLKQQQQQQLQR